jgi:dihydroorotase
VQAVEILSRGYERYGIERPSLGIGSKASISLFNPLQFYTQSLTDLYSSSKNSLYLGSHLKGRALGSIANNHLTLI